MAKIKSEKPEMSAFERKRLENIAANQALLKDLSTVASKIIPKASPKPRSSTPRKKTTPVKREPLRPTRQSSRIAGIDPESEAGKRKAEIDDEFAKEQAKAKRLRVAGDLNVNDIVAEGKKWQKGQDFLSGIMRGAQPNQRTFTEDDVKETTDEGLKKLREQMSGLSIYEGWEPNRMCCTSITICFADISFQKSKLPLNAYTVWAFILPKKNPSYLLETRWEI